MNIHSIILLVPTLLVKLASFTAIWLGLQFSELISQWPPRLLLQWDSVLFAWPAFNTLLEMSPLHRKLAKANYWTFSTYVELFNEKIIWELSQSSRAKCFWVSHVSHIRYVSFKLEVSSKSEPEKIFWGVALSLCCTFSQTQNACLVPKGLIDSIPLYQRLRGLLWIWMAIKIMSMATRPAPWF